MAARKMASQKSRRDIARLHTGTGVKLVRGTSQIQGVDLKARAFRQSCWGQVHCSLSLPSWEETSISKEITLSFAGGSIFPPNGKGAIESQGEVKQVSNLQMPVFR